MPVDFGSDISTFPTLDPNFRLITGTQVIFEAVLRRLMTPRGSLAYDLDYGTDVRGMLNASTTSSELFALQASIEAEAEKDERVLRADAVITQLQTFVYRIDLSLTTSAGPFLLVLAATPTALTVLRR